MKAQPKNTRVYIASGVPVDMGRSSAINWDNEHATQWAKMLADMVAAAVGHETPEFLVDHFDPVDFKFLNSPQKICRNAVMDGAHCDLDAMVVCVRVDADWEFLKNLRARHIWARTIPTLAIDFNGTQTRKTHRTGNTIEIGCMGFVDCYSRHTPLPRFNPDFLAELGIAYHALRLGHAQTQQAIVVKVREARGLALAA